MTTYQFFPTLIIAVLSGCQLVQWRIQDLKKGGGGAQIFGVHFSQFKELFKVFGENNFKLLPQARQTCRHAI